MTGRFSFRVDAQSDNHRGRLVKSCAQPACGARECGFIVVRSVRRCADPIRRRRWFGLLSARPFEGVEATCNRNKLVTLGRWYFALLR